MQSLVIQQLGQSYRHWRLRLTAKFHGIVRHSKVLWELAGTLLFVASLSPMFRREQRLEWLVTSLRRTTSSSIRPLQCRVLKKWLQPSRQDVWRSMRIGWKAYYHDPFGSVNETALTDSLLLKQPGVNGEKGILYSSFEYNWLRLLAHHDATRFFQRYMLVGASSWSPPHYQVLASLCGVSDDPVFLGISNFADLEAYALFRPWVRALPILASDWIDPDLFHPKPHGERSIDILMVANWARFKRHWILFEALRSMPKDLRVVLVGRVSPDRDAQAVRDEALAFGVRQDLELLTDIHIEDVYSLLADARVSAIFSAREGSCVATCEAFFANTPVAMMEDGHVGSKAHVNPHTGRLLRRGCVGHDLMQMIEKSDLFSPRAWALDRITCHHSSAKLNSLLRDYCLSVGQPWTSDIKPIRWKYVPEFLSETDELATRSGVEEIRQLFGIVLAPWTQGVAQR